MSTTATRMTVDGTESDVVLDGTSGSVKDDLLVVPALEDLVRALAKANSALGEATIAKKRASDTHKDAQGAVNAVVAQIVAHYGEEHAQMTLGADEAQTEMPEDSDEADEE